MASPNGITFSVFTKPWKMPVRELGEFIRGLGFEGIELPVRPGYQVEPQNAGRDLAKATRELGKCGVKVCSVAGPADEPTIAACAEAGIPVIRVMARMNDAPYLERVAQIQREYDALVPILDRHGVTLGIQNHVGRFVANASGLRHLIEKYDPRHIAAVWDAGHEAVAGTNEVDLVIDVVWSHLCMVNLKNAFWLRANGPEADVARWQPYWTSGRHGLASWPRVASELNRRNYRGVVCLTAEYSDPSIVNRQIAEDLAFARSLFTGATRSGSDSP